MIKFTLALFLLFSFVSCGELTGKSTGANDGIFDDLVGGLPFLEVGGGKRLLKGEMVFKPAIALRCDFAYQLANQ